VTLAKPVVPAPVATPTIPTAVPRLATTAPAAAAPASASAKAASPVARPAATMPQVDARSLPPTVAAMVEAIRLYDDLLIEENAALKASDAKTVEALLERKTAATRLYQERLRSLLSDPQNTRSLPPDQRNTVIAMVRCLEERTKENSILLKANMGAIEQLFEVINTAARKARRQDLAYSKAGTMRDIYTRNSVSMAYNSTI
jgi:hypothetical protein